MAKTFADSGGTRLVEDPMTNVKQHLADRIRPMLRGALVLQARNQQSGGQETPQEPVCAAASVQPITEVPWPDREMLGTFSRVAARRRVISVAWDNPSPSWDKQIKVEK